MDTMNTLIFNVLVALVVALVGIVTRQLLPYLKEKKEEATEKIRQTRWAWCADIIDAVVRAVEQTVTDIHGEEKKAEAVTWISRIFWQAGIHSLTDDQIDALIEAAVQEMNAGSMEVFEDDPD